MKRSDRHRSRPRRWTTTVLGVLVTVGPIVGSTTVVADHVGAATSTGTVSSHDGVTVVRQLPGATVKPSTPLPASTGGGDAPSPGPDLAHRIGGHQPDAKVAAGSAATTNWSGAVATGGTFDGIASHWTVPAVQPSSTPEYSATWIGIDGWGRNTDLIQVGTANTPPTTTPQYFAWYEILPTDPVAIPITDPVSAGDEMTAEIYKVDNRRHMGRRHHGHDEGVDFGDTTAYTGPTTSAEWIEEAPTVSTSQSTLADFGSVQFTTAVTASSTTDFTRDADLHGGRPPYTDHRLSRHPDDRRLLRLLRHTETGGDVRQSEPGQHRRRDERDDRRHLPHVAVPAGDRGRLRDNAGDVVLGQRSVDHRHRATRQRGHRRRPGRDRRRVQPDEPGRSVHLRRTDATPRTDAHPAGGAVLRLRHGRLRRRCLRLPGRPVRRLLRLAAR